MKKSISPSQIAIGYGLIIAIGLFITFAIYPFIIHRCNHKALQAFFMFSSSTIIRYLIIVIYDWSKIDWLLIENLKARKKNRRKENNIVRRIKKLKKVGNWALFIGLVCFDPMITALYYRQGYYQWDNIHQFKIKILFIVSNIICALLMGRIINFVFSIVF